MLARPTKPRFDFDIYDRAVLRGDEGVVFDTRQDAAHYANQRLPAITPAHAMPQGRRTSGLHRFGDERGMSPGPFGLPVVWGTLADPMILPERHRIGSSR